MAYPKRELVIVPECNDENDNPCCWAMLVSECDNGRHYLWICKYDEKEYVVENSAGYNLADGKTYKTLSGAKKQAEAIAWRQDESGCFTD